MKSLKLLLKLYRKQFIALIVFFSISGYILGLYVGQPQTKTKAELESTTVTSSGTIVGRIQLEVSPSAYPVSGESWTIFVYSVNKDPAHSFSPLPNSTVTVNVRENGFDKTYNISVDANGQAKFQYIPGYTDVAFQAHYENDNSNKIVITSYYVSPNVLETLLLTNGLMSPIAAIVSGLAIRNKKAKTALNVLLLLSFVIFAVVTILSVYVRFTLETVWGYPENIFQGIVTIDTLEYATIAGIVVFCFAVFSALILNARQSDSSIEDKVRTNMS